MEKRRKSTEKKIPKSWRNIKTGILISVKDI